jgi:PilZ domain
MLGISHECDVIEELWAVADACTQLPLRTARDFLELQGPLPRHFSTRRSFHRFYLRSKAALIQGDRIYGVYTTDISRQGIGILSPRQLMPREKWTLKLANGGAYELRVKRYRRESEGCFACGARFTR